MFEPLNHLSSLCTTVSMADYVKTGGGRNGKTLGLRYRLLLTSSEGQKSNLVEMVHKELLRVLNMSCGIFPVFAVICTRAFIAVIPASLIVCLLILKLSAVV